MLFIYQTICLMQILLKLGANLILANKWDEQWSPEIYIQ